MPLSATPGASLANGVRPPTASHREHAPSPGVAGPPDRRPTAAVRPDVCPAPWHGAGVVEGFPTSHPYVRRFWTAAIGPGAVADLMRLAVAAERGRSLPRPESMAVLVKEDLARWVGGRLYVRTAIPRLSPAQERRLTPALRRQHRSA